MKKKLITTLIIIVAVLILIWVANMLVSNFNVEGFIKSLHGG